MEHLEFKNQLKNIYKHRIEMHAHTNPVSPCSRCAAKDIVKIYKDLGYDAICITNHLFAAIFETTQIYTSMGKEERIDRFLADFNEAKLEGEKLGITVILGAELRFVENDNDYLIYGIDRDDLLNIYDHLSGTVEEFRKSVSLPKSVFIQAHPFRSPSTPADITLLDGIETFNMHFALNSRVSLAIRHAKDNNIGITTCGSDFHLPDTGNEGGAALCTKTVPKDTFEIAEILKSRDYVFELSGSSIVLP